MSQTVIYILIAVFVALFAFIYRFFTNPFFFARVVRFFLCFRYRAELRGFEQVMSSPRFLIMPNHPAYVDPFLLFTAIYARNRKASPMTDEKFFRNAAYRQILKLGDAVIVPDLTKNRSEVAVRQAAELVHIAVKALDEGRSLVFYPSGHVTLDGKENIGARRLAFETVSSIQLSPADSPLRQVRLFLLRTRGLETSRTAKSRSKLLDKKGHVRQDALPWTFTQPKWYQRRHVTMHFEDMTDTLLEWARQYDKSGFNRKLEEWYNQTNESPKQTN